MAEIRAQNFDEILKLRRTLEDLALRKYIAKADDALYDKLVLDHHRMVHSKDVNEATFEDLHTLFHMALLGNASSPILLKFCSQLHDLNIRYRFVMGRP